ncbi:unnamed protein product [Urochloa humidicola]
MASSSSISNPLAGAQVIEKLTKQSHAMWATQVLAVIHGARLEGRISSRVAPAATIDHKVVDGKTVKISNPVHEEWEVRDQHILSFPHIPRDVMSQVASTRTTSLAWKAIDDMFASQTRAWAINVRLALATTKKGTLTISGYFGKMRSLGDEMAASGKSIEDEELVAFILNSLDADFNPIVSALVSTVEPISLGELYSQLLSFETRLDLQHGDSSSSANRSGNMNYGWSDLSTEP